MAMQPTKTTPGPKNATPVVAPRKESVRTQSPGAERQAGLPIAKDNPLVSTPPPRPRTAKALTIGAVCQILEREFPDITISKIRYLEGEKLLSPRRTPGGYRLYSAADVERLQTILRLQRDEFLPLRVIRQELAAGRGAEGDGSSTEGSADSAAASSPRRVEISMQSRGALYSVESMLEYSGASRELLAELEEYGIISGEKRKGERYYDDIEREVVLAVSKLARYGVEGRNLRIFRTSAEREVTLLRQILSPKLRSRNPERRQEAVDALENLTSVASHLKYLLLVRELRELVQ